MMELRQALHIEARHADHMTEMARYWMARCQRAELHAVQAAGMLVEAVGGEIRVPVSVMQRLPDLELEKCHNHATGEDIYRTRKASQTHP